MSDLQLALIVLGAIIIGGVLAYNWLQEKKLRKQVTSDFIVPQKDVLNDDFHIDTDAYIIDKEMAEMAQKAKQSALPIDEQTVPNTIQNAAQEFNSDDIDQEPLLTNTDESNFVESQVLAAEAETENEASQYIQEPTAQNPPIIKAVLHEKIQDSLVNLPATTHPQIDLTAVLFASKNILAKDLTALNDALAQINLPNSLHGLDSHDNQQNNQQEKWQTISVESANSFKQLACSLQLADRGGPVAKNVLNKFQFAVEDAGLSLNAHVEWQNNADAMQRAIELDQFCIEVDQMVSVHIAENEVPIHGTKFKGLAEANGMLLKDDGKFYLSANDVNLFTAIDTNNVPFTAESLRSNVLKSITFQMEIPKVNNSEQVFNQMIALAQKMASNLGGSLVDDNQKPLGDLQIEKIRQQLKVIHATMVARGIMPGSPASMRLFN